jgi:hypothetical protein
MIITDHLYLQISWLTLLNGSQKEMLCSGYQQRAAVKSLKHISMSVAVIKNFF